MANLITGQMSAFSHTYAGEEVTELFLKPLFKNEDVLNRYRVMTDVVGKRNIYLRGVAAKIIQKITGCDTADRGAMAITDKTIETEKLGIRLSQCEDEFDGTIFERVWQRRGADRQDLTGTETERVIIDWMQDGLERDIPRLLWWASTAASNVDWKQFDGWLKKMVDTTGTLGKKIDITTYETANALDTDGALKVFRQMWKDAPQELRDFGKANLRFYVTPGLIDNYEDTIEDKGNDYGSRAMLGDVPTQAYKRIPLVEMGAWATDIDDADNPIKASLNTTSSNIAVLTVPDNLIIGIDETNAANANRAKVWLDDNKDKLRAKLDWQMGAQLLHEKLIVFAC